MSNRLGRLSFRAGSGDNNNAHPERSASGSRKKPTWPRFGGRQREEFAEHVGKDVTLEWQIIQVELKELERSVEPGAQFIEPQSAITTQHWRKNADYSNCSNKKCKRALWAMSKHHCRKCGYIFCAKCVQFRRRLSPNAEYDPNGWLYKVCETCYGLHEQEMGQSRRWTYDLQLFRQARHKQEGSKQTRAAVLRICKSLVEGFQANYSSGSISPQPGSLSPTKEDKSKNFFSRLKNGVTNVVKHGVPQWQKCPGWVSEGTSCQCCSKPYGKLDSQHNCRICGRLVCRAQSSKDLLLYTPDKSDQGELGVEPRWAVIRVVGSPEVEPDHHLYLRVCNPCLDQLKEIQVSDQQRLRLEGTLVHVCWSELDQTYRDIMKIQTKIDASIPEFQKLIDGLEIDRGAPASLPPNRSNMQLLAKHQGDLSDHLSLFVITVTKLKKLSPQNQTQVKLVRKLITCKFGYYNEINGLYRKLKKQLEEIAPQEVLREIQSIVDQKAINSACLTLNQMAYECLHLLSKYKLDQSLALTIKQSAEVCEEDLKKKLLLLGEEWTEHKEQIDMFVRLQIKGDPESNTNPRPFIHPSRRRIKMSGALYVERFVNQRVLDLTNKVRVQLASRTADRSFKLTKEALDSLMNSLTEGRERDDEEYVFL